MAHLTILSRKNCHLCNVIHRIALHLQEELAFELTQVDVDQDRSLAEQYSHRIPVVLIDQVEACSGKITEGELRRAIKKARWSRPISRILSRLKHVLTRR